MSKRLISNEMIDDFFDLIANNFNKKNIKSGLKSKGYIVEDEERDPNYDGHKAYIEYKQKLSENLANRFKKRYWRGDYDV